MDNIYTDVIIYKDRVGRLLEKRECDKIVYRFCPAGHGKYYRDFEKEFELVAHPETDVKIAGEASGKEYAIKEFERRDRCTVIDYIKINERYQIIVDNNGLYYPHIKYKSTSRAFKDIASALIGMIIYDKMGTDDLHLNKYVFKLLDMEW